jgi:3-oxoacyl-[acyl-carrier protein] reductase
MSKLDGQIALVTGASKGIGRSIALAFAREGADVAGTYHPSEPHPSDVAAAIEAAGRQSLLLPCEVADEASVQAAVRQTIERLGRIDVLVTNAGFAEETPVAAMTVDQFDRMVSVHLRGTFLCVRAVLPVMIERGAGTIITMASQLAYIGAEGLAHYAAAKAGIVAFTKSLAREVCRQGVRVNGIAPGPIRTGILPGNPARDAELAARLPIGRFGEVDEVAPTAVFLASSDASYYVGQILGPNGGEVML